VPKNICENFNSPSFFKTLKTNKPIDKILQDKKHILHKNLTIDQINFINDKEVLFKNKDKKSTTFYKIQSLNNNKVCKNKYVSNININNKNVSKHEINNNFQQYDCELQYKNYINETNFNNNKIKLNFNNKNKDFKVKYKAKENNQLPKINDHTELF
jgi:hypothetical protein